MSAAGFETPASFQQREDGKPLFVTCGEPMGVSTSISLQPGAFHKVITKVLPHALAWYLGGVSQSFYAIWPSACGTREKGGENHNRDKGLDPNPRNQETKKKQSN